MLRLMILLGLAMGCAGLDRTKYRPWEKNEGYREKQLEGDVQLSSFRGNKHTSKAQAELFAKFRAVEVCQDSGKKIAHFLSVSDRTQARDITRTSSNMFGPGFYHGMGFGMYPYYGRHPRFGFSAGFHTMHSDSWRETLIFPEVAVFFHCEEQVYEPMLSLREVSADEMRILVKDLKGAVQVEKVLPGSPNSGSIESGDVLLRVGGERIQSILELLQAAKASPNSAVTVDVFREGERKKLSLRSQDVTESIQRTQEKIIAEACANEDVKERPLCGGA
jgi:hypothetical protein